MNPAREGLCQKCVTGESAAPAGLPRTLVSFVLAAAFVLPAASALAQEGGANPFMPKFSIGGEQKRKLTPEEEERQKQLDADYKAATKKIPDQKARDPWADVRHAPSTADAKRKQQ